MGLMGAETTPVGRDVIPTLRQQKPKVRTRTWGVGVAALGVRKAWRVFGPPGVRNGGVAAIAASARPRVEPCKVQPVDPGLPLN